MVTMSNEQLYNVWLQPGTRAHMLVYQPNTKSWQLWVATDSRSGNSDNWLGTYLECYPDGCVVQVYKSETDLRTIIVRDAMNGEAK